HGIAGRSSGNLLSRGLRPWLGSGRCRRWVAARGATGRTAARTDGVGWPAVTQGDLDELLVEAEAVVVQALEEQVDREPHRADRQGGSDQRPAQGALAELAGQQERQDGDGRAEDLERSQQDPRPPPATRRRRPLDLDAAVLAQALEEDVGRQLLVLLDDVGEQRGGEPPRQHGGVPAAGVV